MHLSLLKNRDDALSHRSVVSGLATVEIVGFGWYTKPY